MVDPMVEKYAEDVANGLPKFDIDGVAEFEEMVKQKRFTRDEIERLTTLLRSRTANGSIRDEEASEGNPPIKISNQQLLEEHTLTPQQVFYKDMTNPSELAKAYMRSRTSNLSSLVSDSRGLTPSSWTPNIAFGSKSLFGSSLLDSGLLSLSSPSQTIASNSGHGRYTRTHQPSSLKGSELRKIAFGEPSSSVHELSVGQHRASGFGEMSRSRNSVLQDQFGSIGPIRRVRQKLNLLNSKTIDAPACGSSSPISGSSVQSEALADPPTLSVDPAPTQLSKADQQPAPPLDLVVSSQNEATSDQVAGGAMGKSSRTSAPESPARQFFRNLEKGEPSGATEYAQCDTMDSTRDTSLRDSDYSVMEYGKSSENEQKAPESFSARNNVLKNNPVADKATVFEEKSSTVEPLQKKQGFRMSVLEDFIDVDDDDAEGTHIEIVSGALNGERRPLISSTGTSIVSTDATGIEKSSPFFPAGSFATGGETGLETSGGPVISEKSISLRGSVATSSLSNQSAVPNGVSKLSAPLMFESLPIVDSTSSGLKPHASSDSKLEASRIGSGLADDKTSKSSEGDGVNSSPEASHEFLKPQVETIATAPVLESSTIFSFGNATSNKGSLLSGSSSSGSPLSSTVLHSNFICDTTQYNLHATHSASVGSSIGLLSSSAGSVATLPILNFGSHAENSTPQVSSNLSSVSTVSEAKASSDYGNELAGVKESTVGSERAPTTSLSASMIGSAGTANNISASSLNSMSPSTQFFTSGTPTATQFTSSSSIAASSLFGSVASTAGFSTGVASTAVLSTGAATAASSLFGPIASTAGLFVGASSSAAVATSIASSPASATAPNANFVFGASPATAGGSGFAFGANSTPGLATTTTTNTGSAFGISLTPASATTSSGISLGTSSATAGFTFGAPSTSAISSSGLSFGVSSTPASTSSGQPFGALSTPATTNSGLPFGTSSAPATGSTSSGFLLGASSATGTTAATAFFAGSSSAPTSSSSSAFSFGASSTPTGATAPAFLFGVSSASTPVTSTAGAGLPYGTSSSHAGGAFPFGASSSAASSSSSGFSFGSSSAPNQFSFGAASTPAVNTGSPFGFMSGTSTSPFHSGVANNTSSSQLVFGNSNPFAANNNGMEDSMAEDSVQAPPPSFPAFGQTTPNTSSGFSFNAATPAGTSNPFQFASQPNLSNPSPFQASSSLGGFSAGGSFSLGSAGGGDKSNRRIIKPKKGRRK
uniref:Nuclear pore complex protein n=2 Tax=Kalanchoe fedtschenkoi TaxID=63787 RepID=A0A7N0T697_KALFE